jgi:diguanylate cyclase (GGDEF)-like protein/PAS domain S-box-containing protein
MATVGGGLTVLLVLTKGPTWGLLGGLALAAGLAAGYWLCYQSLTQLRRELQQAHSRLHTHAKTLPDWDTTGAVGGFSAGGTDTSEGLKTEKALQALTSVFERTPDFVAQIDRHGVIGYMNPALRNAAGIPAGEAPFQRRVSGFFTPYTQEQLRREIWPALRTKGIWLGKLDLCWQDLSQMPMQGLVIAHRNQAGRVERFSAVMRDISLEVQTQHDAVRQAASLHSVAESIPAAVAVVDKEGVYQYINRSFENWLNLPRAQVIGKKGMELLGEYEFNRRWPWALRALAGEHVSYRLDYPSRERTRYMAIEYIPMQDTAGEADGFVIVAQDVSAQVHEEERLLQISEHDPMTGLSNRAGFERKMALALQEGHGPTLALLYVDLDHFKPVNDQFGHAAGDEVLKLFGKRLLNIVRPSDVVVRLGGDEFAIVLVRLHERADAQGIADKVLAAANEPFHVDGSLITVGASIGVAYGVDPVLGYQDLMARADAKLFRAKKLGRGRQVGAVAQNP